MGLAIAEPCLSQPNSITRLRFHSGKDESINSFEVQAATGSDRLHLPVTHVDLIRLIPLAAHFNCNLKRNLLSNENDEEQLIKIGLLF